jgi:hypothetical protein
VSRLKERYIVPPRFVGLMTGVQYAVIRGRNCRIMHDDGVIEEAELEEEPHCRTNEDFMELVRRVQRAASLQDNPGNAIDHGINTVVIQVDSKPS